jgi:creatinine amidohydrolase/Fe(II)-dependent formamide hydrolase-like protein
MDTQTQPAPLSRTLTRIAIITAFTAVCALTAAAVVNFGMDRMVIHAARQIEEPDPTQPNPIAAHDTVFIEEMTWMEVRDAMKAGKNTVIIASGGVEQCGPYLVMGKHNYVCRATTEAIARKLGNALVAPIIPFVPQGDIDPPTIHMKYAGTVSLTEETYRTLVREICMCYRTHGFAHVILIGDSGGNLEGMKAVAAELSERWKGTKNWKGQESTIHYIAEYHDADVNGWLQANGVPEGKEWIHDNFATTATIMTIDPTLVRAKERLAAGNFKVNYVDLSPEENTIRWGKKVVDFRAEATVKAIRKATGEAKE